MRVCVCVRHLLHFFLSNLSLCQMRLLCQLFFGLSVINNCHSYCLFVVFWGFFFFSFFVVKVGTLYLCPFSLFVVTGYNITDFVARVTHFLFFVLHIVCEDEWDLEQPRKTG